MRHAREERAAVRALTAAFFTRFFESDTTLERTDATRSFMWLVAVLGAPILLLTFYCQFSWELLARHRHGVEAFRLSARFDASLYLALTFVGISVVAAARWQSLLIDRRDALVLGTLPIRPRTIVVAKLAALAGYTALLAVGMHVLSSGVYGISLGGLQRPTNIFRTFAGHLAAGAGLTVFVITAVAAAQAVGLALLGPRRFHRSSVALQMLLVAVVLAVFVAMPGKSATALATFSTTGVVGPAWIGWLPPLWFVGLFEAVAGTASPELQALGRTAVEALALSILSLLVAAPVAGWRSLRMTLGAAAPARHPLSRRAAAVLTRTLSRVPAVRGAVQFTLATLGRVPAPRLVMALFSGVGLMGIVPVAIAQRMSETGRPEATTTVLALPFVLLFFFLLGLRLAIKTPVELPGRWLFDQTDVSPLAGRRAAWGILFALGVVPPVMLTAVLWTAFFGSAVGLGRTAAALAGGMLALEILLYGYVGVPCSRPAVAEAFKGRTLGLVVGFEIFCFESAAAQAGWQDQVWPVLVQAALFLAGALGVHAASRRAAALNAVVDEHLEARLNLEVVGSLADHERRSRQTQAG
jgi:hypothetical protein